MFSKRCGLALPGHPENGTHSCSLQPCSVCTAPHRPTARCVAAVRENIDAASACTTLRSFEPLQHLRPRRAVPVARRAVAAEPRRANLAQRTDRTDRTDRPGNSGSVERHDPARPDDHHPCAAARALTPLAMADSKLPIYGAIAANAAIAVTKFTVAGITGSSAMLSEGVPAEAPAVPAPEPPVQDAP